MYQALVVCRSGLGSSLMLRLKLEQIIEEHKLPIALEHDPMSFGDLPAADLVITMQDLVPELEKSLEAPVYGVKSLTDKEELTQLLQSFLDSKK